MKQHLRDSSHSTLAVAGIAASSVVMLAADVLNFDIVYRGALLGFMVTGAWFFAQRTGATAAVIERTRQAGYDDGYDDGRRTPRLSVVSAGPGATVALGRASGEFRQ